MWLNLKRFEIERLEQWSDGDEVKREGIFTTWVLDRFDLADDDRKLCDKVWDELHAPRFEVNCWSKPTIFFFKDAAFERWKLYDFAKALVSTAAEECQAKCLIIQGKFNINRQFLVYEDEYQVCIDLEYYKDKLMKHSETVELGRL